VDYVDEIAYNNHDVDDGLKLRMFTVEQIREVALFREAHDEALARGYQDERIARHHVVRWIIDRCVRDLIETRPGEPRGGGRRVGGRRARAAAGSWPTLRRWRAGPELKEFSSATCTGTIEWCGWENKGRRLLRALFESYVGEPRQLPPGFQGQLERDGVHRLVCDYIAGMTDRFAWTSIRKLFDRACGSKAAKRALDRHPRPVDRLRRGPGGAGFLVTRR